MSERSRPRTTSRAPAARPRRLAGRSGPSVPARTDGPSTSAEELEREPAPPEPELEPEPVDAPPTEREEPDDAPRASIFAGRRTTTRLLAIVVVLTVLSLGMAGYLLLGGADDPAPSSASDTVVDGAIDVPDDRPILLPWADAQAAAAAAAEAATTIIGTSWQDYDEQVEEAAALMTPAFAEEYRETASGATQQGIVDGKVEVQVRVVSQSVVRANTSQAQVLLFLNQYITKPGPDGKSGTTVSPYRALVTVVNTDGGWLVSGLETR